MTFTHGLSTNNYGPAKWIVDPSAANGTNTTIASALTSASSGDTIFIRPGTYTENLTLKAGVNLTAFGSDGSQNGTGKVIISGNATFSTAGSVTISGIQLQTNSAAFLTVSGSAASIVNLDNCYLNASNSTGISYSTSNASSAIFINNCWGNLGTTGIGMHTMSSTGNLSYFASMINNSGASTTASSNSAGTVSIAQSSFNITFSTSSSGIINIFNSVIDASTVNATTLTTAGTGTSTSFDCYFNSGTSSSISVGAGTTLNLLNSFCGSSNTNNITGAGTIFYSGLSLNTSKNINVTTQSGGTLPGGTFQAPSAGFLGQQINNSASSVSISNATPTNITSISLTAGVWDVSGIAYFTFTGNNTSIQLGISATSATFAGTLGDQQIAFATSISAAAYGISIPSFRVVITTTTTYFLVGQTTFSTGTSSANGRISATRVA